LYPREFLLFLPPTEILIRISLEKERGKRKEIAIILILVKLRANLE